MLNSEKGAEEIEFLVFGLCIGAERRRNELLRVLDPLHRIEIAEKMNIMTVNYYYGQRKALQGLIQMHKNIV